MKNKKNFSWNFKKPAIFFRKYKNVEIQLDFWKIFKFIRNLKINLKIQWISFFRKKA